MMTLVFFLEERSAKEMLKGILSRILPDHVVPQIIHFEGKQDLEKQLPRKLRLWKVPNSKFLIMRDQDSGDCRTVKQKLTDICRAADRPETVVRIACHELESFYIGDLEAVEKDPEISGLAKLQSKKKFREPDALSNPAQELIRLTKKRYQKISGSRAVGTHLNLEENRSHSFNVLIQSIRRIAAGDGE